MRSILSSFCVAAAAALTACGGSQAPAKPVSAPSGDVGERPAPPVSTKPVTNQTLAAIGLDPATLDRTADPCDDFYQYACGGWIAATEIPADKPLAMRSFVSIEDRNLEYEHGLLDKLRARPGDEPGAAQLAAFYGSCMDEPAIEKAGLSALRPLLAAIDQVKDTRSLTQAIAALHASGVAALFALDPTQDSADARNVIANLDQGGLGLPDRDYYLNDDDASKAIRAGYLTYVETVLGAIGNKAPRPAATAILALETEIAKVSKDKVARRDPHGMYNKIDRAGVAKAMPRFDWDAFFAAIGLPSVRDITVTSPELLAGLNGLLASTRPETWATWRAYLAFHLTSAAAGVSTRQLEDAQFKLESSLTGQPELPPRWRRCVQRTEEALGDLVGQAFVRDRFGGESKAAAEGQVHAIVAAMAANLDTLPWMDPATRAKAHAKLAAMTYQIGYPNKWKTYRFKLDPRAWTANALAARKAEHARQLAKIGKPVDKDDWQLAAPQVNAYYDPQLNGMVFPAGILQSPFYSVGSSIPVNLGGMGMVVGHELTHGFDDEGRQFDPDGNLRDWWTKTVSAEFDRRATCVEKQFDDYVVVDDAHVKGKLTLGENIADLGGVKLAYATFERGEKQNGAAPAGGGFTPEQQFFLGFAQSWCANYRPEALRLLVATNPHSPPRYRVDGPLSNLPELGAAFQCADPSPMVRSKEKRCEVW
jgi:putative endopeptidase